jgi:hypothetical protein
MPARPASSFNRSQGAIGVRHPVHQGGTKSARSKPQHAVLVVHCQQDGGLA